ncbi:hydroxyphenylacetyl-CoA thioesterase PaaI [Kitasatospora phosalacinea]|uniref:hydroxyphenylacetyl-CoA thioesterase PaaI n=1 Tax=Kitasatospora phosalacinea TaxID=2065 RepID=UPI0005274646|nr:hydroxyphenylacetyl-CoA thioesterase PaaI [Kitasatospora phosalacinea]
MFERDRAARGAGIVLEEVSGGRAVARMKVTEEMADAHGIGHGGYVFLLADTAFSYACDSYGPVAFAQGAQITFLAPAQLGDELVAEAVERTLAGRNGVYDVTVRTAAGTVVAEFRGQSTLVTGPPHSG